MSVRQRPRPRERDARSTSATGERVGPGDLTMLAADRGPAPMNIAALIRVEDGSRLPPELVRATLSARTEHAPRLRQRVVWSRSLRRHRVWAEASDFTIEDHLDFRCDACTDEELFSLFAERACIRLPRDLPLWHATWVSGLPDGSAALIFVVHHVVTDGYGGLALLQLLSDAAEPAAESRAVGPKSDTHRPSGATPAPNHPPGKVNTTVRRALRGLAELGVGEGHPRLAERTAYNRPTGPRRRVTTVTRPLSDTVHIAHQRGCTLNDIVLSCVVGALASTLAESGEHHRRIVVSVPVSARPREAASRLGNATGVVPLAVPTEVRTEERLEWISATMAGHRAARSVTGMAPRSGTDARREAHRGESAGPLGLAFRGLARVGLFQAFIEHQRLVNTFVTNVRGPVAPLFIAGHRVTSIVPATVNPGNVGVVFVVLSYAGRLVISLVADPDIVAEQKTLTDRLDIELRRITHIP